MITNDDKIGNYWVSIIANKKRVHSFQVRALENAKEEALRIWDKRGRKGLPTKRMFARQIVGKLPRRGLMLSEVEYEL